MLFAAASLVTDGPWPIDSPSLEQCRQRTIALVSHPSGHFLGRSSELEKKDKGGRQGHVALFRARL